MRKRMLLPSPVFRRELRVTPVKLCHEISRLFHARMREEGELDGVLTQPGARAILSMLAVTDGLSQLELVRGTHLRPATVSVILRKMEEEGMVLRKSDPQDKRILRAYLSDLGRQKDAHMILRIQKNDACALRGFSEEENQLLMSFLGRIRDNLLSDTAKEKKEAEK